MPDSGKNSKKTACTEKCGTNDTEDQQEFMFMNCDDFHSVNAPDNEYENIIKHKMIFDKFL